MTTYTRAQLATQARKHAGLTAINETPSSEEQTQAEEIVEAAIGTLNGLGVRIWNGNDNSVSHEHLLPLIEYMVPVLLRVNGQIDYATSIQLQAAAEARLRALGMTGPTGEVLATEYF